MSAPRNRALKVNSAMERDAGTNGTKGFLSIGRLMEWGRIDGASAGAWQTRLGPDDGAHGSLARAALSIRL
jgi:hypothetical protein